MTRYLSCCGQQHPPRQCLHRVLDLYRSDSTPSTSFLLITNAQMPVHLSQLRPQTPMSAGGPGCPELAPQSLHYRAIFTAVYRVDPTKSNPLPLPHPCPHLSRPLDPPFPIPQPRPRPQPPIMITAHPSFSLGTTSLSKSSPRWQTAITLGRVLTLIYRE